MKKRFAKFLFETVHGWSFVGDPPPQEVHRCVFVFAPHTSNWDFYFGVLCMMSMGVPIRAAIKNFWTKFPFSLIIKPLGGVGIDRSSGGKKRDQVSMLAEVFDKNEHIAFVITPEGTRKKRTRWKMGFYHVAKKANVPMVSFAADFSKRQCWFGPVHTPDEKLEDVMTSMTSFFGGAVAYHPELFSLDERYVS